MKKTAAELEYLDELIEEITTDANGEDEQRWAFLQAFADDMWSLAQLPLPARRSRF